MPRLTRRVAAQAGLATAGTLVAALAVRKCLPPARDPHPDAMPPALQGLAALQPVAPPARLPNYSWREFDRAGAAHPRSLADYAGRPVILNIWATWCGPCVHEMPSLATLSHSLRPVGVAVLPVSIDRAGAAPVRNFFDRLAITGLPVLCDVDAGAITSLGIGAVPVTMLIGSEGLLRARIDGGADWNSPGAAEIVRRLTGS